MNIILFKGRGREETGANCKNSFRLYSFGNISKRRSVLDWGLSVERPKSRDPAVSIRE